MRVFKCILQLYLRVTYASFAHMNSKQIIGHIMSVTGESISALAASNGYTKQAFYDVIKGRTKTKHLQELISAITGLPVSTLWPRATPSQKSTEEAA